MVPLCELSAVCTARVRAVHVTFRALWSPLGVLKAEGAVLEAYRQLCESLFLSLPVSVYSKME